MQTTEQVNQRAAHLYWLAFLLTGDQDPSLDIALDTIETANGENPFFSTWMAAWSRRVVIAKALAAIRQELGASAQRTASKRPGKFVAGGNTPLPEGVTKAQIETALLAIDAFPRCVLLLTVFEQVSLQDAAVLLDADRKLIEKGRGMGLRELNRNLQTVDKRTPVGANSLVMSLEIQHA